MGLDRLESSQIEMCSSEVEVKCTEEVTTFGDASSFAKSAIQFRNLDQFLVIKPNHNPTEHKRGRV